MKSMRPLTILAGVVVMLGMYQLASNNDLLADVDSPVCCEDGDCKTYYKQEDDGEFYFRVHRCSDAAHIRDTNNCSNQPTKTCGECVNRQNSLDLCWLNGHNEYCCEVNPWRGTYSDDYCPEQYRRYACDWPTASVLGPSELLPNHSGTFTAHVTGEPSFSYAWYKWRTCGQSCVPEDEDDGIEPSGTDDLPCCRWKPIGYGSSLQTQDQWDFYLKIEVTDDCWAGPRTVTSPAYYVYVGEVFARRNNNNEELAEQLSARPQRFTHELTSHPNPFNASTKISFSLPQASRISIAMYNAYGQRVRTLLSNQEFATGTHSVLWDGKNDRGENAASGIYLCRLSSENGVKVLRLALMK